MKNTQNTQAIKRLFAFALAAAMSLSLFTGAERGMAQEEQDGMPSLEATESSPTIGAEPDLAPDPGPGLAPDPDPEPAPGPLGMQPMSAFGNDGIEALSVTVSPESYQTWTELTNGTTPPDLVVSLSVTLSEFYTDGGAIRLPIDNLTPTLSTHPNFTYGTDGAGTLEPFFEFDADTPLAAAAAEYAATAPGAVYVILKDKGEPGFQFGIVTIPLHFKFNTNWESKIPGGTVLWSVSPTAEYGGDTVISAAPKTVTGSANNVLSAGAEYANPTNKNYPGGVVGVTARVYNSYHYRTMLDPAYNNIAYIEVPEGSVLGSGFSVYFKDGKITSAGYDRYYRTLNPNPTNSSHTDWNHWNYTGNWNTLYLVSQSSSVFTPPIMSDGAEFQYRMGVEYRQMNGPELKPAPAIRDYKKIARPAWELNAGNRHSTGDSSVALSVSGLSDGAAAHAEIYANSGNYNSGSTTKNTGSEPIRGVSFVLYQKEPESVSKKVNFNKVTLYACRDYEDPPWSRYKVQYEIVDTGGSGGNATTLPLVDDVMGVWDPAPGSSANTVARTKTLLMPSLTATQYINKIILIPMGTDGASEGVWPSRNSFALYYLTGAWTGKMWPDGEAVPAYSTVRMGWTLYGDYNPVKPNAYPSDYDTNPVYDINRGNVLAEGNTATAYYSDAPYAQAALASTNAVNASPGDKVNYTVLGYNHNGFTEGNWVEPRIMVRVPRVMELVGADTSFTGTDAFSNSFSFSAALTYSDSSYNYYSFVALGYSAPQGTQYNPVFSVPVTFDVASTAGPGTYPLRVLVSDGVPASFIESSTLYNSTKNLPTGDDITNYGIAQDDGYYMMPPDSARATTPLTVIAKADIGVKTTIASQTTNGLYVDSAVVPADRGENVNVRLAISNKGNVSLTNIRLYDILPYDGDNLGSSGGISFVSVSPDGSAAVKYTAAAPGSSGAPTYGQHGNMNPDLQTANFNSGWTAAKPALGIRAVYIDFGARTFAPGESIGINMVFHVPNDASDQTAYNQFRYSATVVGDGNAALPSLDSPVAGFSTKAIAIIYDGNLPAHNDGGPGGMPPDLTAIIGFAPATGPNHDTLTVSSMVPALTGYEFAGWNTAPGGTGEYWAAGAEKTFAAGGALVLNAQWTALAPPDTPPDTPPSLPALPPTPPGATPSPTGAETPPPTGAETPPDTTQTPQPSPTLPPVTPVTTTPTPPPPEAPAPPRPTPAPATPGNALIPSGDGYIEIDEDGTPQGTWTWDGDEWVFEEAPPPLGGVPATGDGASPAVPALLFAMSVAGLILSAAQKRKKNQHIDRKI